MTVRALPGSMLSSSASANVCGSRKLSSWIPIARQALENASYRMDFCEEQGACHLVLTIDRSDGVPVPPYRSAPPVSSCKRSVYVRVPLLHFGPRMIRHEGVVG